MNNPECKNIYAKLFTGEENSWILKETIIVVCSLVKMFAVNRFQKTPEFFVLLIINNAYVTKNKLLNFHHLTGLTGN